MRYTMNFTRFTAAILLTMLFAGCDRSYDPVFGEDPDDRLRATLQQYNTALPAAPFGWKAVLETGAGINYYYYFRFHNDGTVDMVSDFDETTAGVTGNGTWMLKALQRPTLSFDTYSYIHLPADPSGSVSGGNNGEGLISDFEFAFARSTDDTLHMEGIQRGSRITLVKATEQEATAAQQGVLKDMLQYMKDNTGLRMEIDGKVITFAFAQVIRGMAAQNLSADGRSVAIQYSAYTFSTHGIELRTPLTLFGKRITHFAWNAETASFTAEGEMQADVVNFESLYFFEPSVPLYASLGTDYRTVQIPQGSGELPGQSDDFIDGYKMMVQSLLEGEYRATLNDINLVFRPADNVMLLDVYISQGATRFLCEFNYNYVINADGSVKFSFNSANDNAWLIYNNVYDAFLRHLEEDTFTTAYVGGGYGLTGGFFSRESTLFSFSGYLYR